jgi:uroporphyrinogen decarboxylase
VIGFAGAPFTLASYAIEGGTSKDFTKTKAFMLSEPAAWRRLLGKLVTVQADYLLAQAAAGAHALQVFDSWAGRALGREDYCATSPRTTGSCTPRSRRAGVPVINFSLGVSAYLEDAAGCGGDVVGLDWTLPLDEAGVGSASTARCRATSTRPLCSRRGPSSRADRRRTRACGSRPGTSSTSGTA